MIHGCTSSTYIILGVRVASAIYKELNHLQMTFLGCLMEGGIIFLYEYNIYLEDIHKNYKI